MTQEKEIVYENATHWVLDKGSKGFEVYRNESTHSARCATIGYTGAQGLQRAISEADKRNTL